MPEIHAWGTLPRAGKTQFPEKSKFDEPDQRSLCHRLQRDSVLPAGGGIASRRIAEEHLAAPSAALKPRGVLAYGQPLPRAVSKLSASSCDEAVGEPKRLDAPKLGDTFLTQKQRDTRRSAANPYSPRSLESGYPRTIHDSTQNSAKWFEMLWEQGVASSNLAVPIAGTHLNKPITPIRATAAVGASVRHTEDAPVSASSALASLAPTRGA